MQKIKELSQRIRLIIENEGISIREFERRTGASYGVFTKVLSSNTDIKSNMLASIAEKFPQYSPAWLLSGEGPMLAQDAQPRNKIPLYETVSSIGGNKDLVADVNQTSNMPEWIDAGDWFPSATAAITHYGDSMVEYPSGSILVLKRVKDVRLLINGADYVIETTEFRITKKLQYQEGWDYIMAHSTNMERYQDGSMVYAPIKIPLDTVRHIDLVVGCVNKKFANGLVSIMER